jgi:tetratricopeptide (TPR) repeat protein
MFSKHDCTVGGISSGFTLFLILLVFLAFRGACNKVEVIPEETKTELKELRQAKEKLEKAEDLRKATASKEESLAKERKTFEEEKQVEQLRKAKEEAESNAKKAFEKKENELKEREEIDRVNRIKEDAKKAARDELENERKELEKERESLRKLREAVPPPVSPKKKTEAEDEGFEKAFATSKKILESRHVISLVDFKKEGEVLKKDFAAWQRKFSAYTTEHGMWAAIHKGKSLAERNRLWEEHQKLGELLVAEKKALDIRKCKMDLKWAE